MPGGRPEDRDGVRDPVLAPFGFHGSGGDESAGPPGEMGSEGTAV
jgi:hypothetical protein